MCFDVLMSSNANLNKRKWHSSLNSRKCTTKLLWVRKRWEREKYKITSVVVMVLSQSDFSNLLLLLVSWSNEQPMGNPNFHCSNNFCAWYELCSSSSYNKKKKTVNFQSRMELVILCKLSNLRVKAYIKAAITILICIGIRC